MARQDPILVTGAAGFIGFHVARRLLGSGREVVGIDNLNAYYDVGLKEARRRELGRFPRFSFLQLDIADRVKIAELFASKRFPFVVHLAAQAGVRYSLIDPHAYGDANLQGFLNVLEGCRHNGCRHLLFASSSSVYGANTRLPFSVHHGADHPISLYAASKRANELMAHAYSHLFALPATGLRFFTVYGPWGRPDMAMFIFASAIIDRRPIRLFNYGRMRRDFTYVDDVTEAVFRLLDRIPEPSQKPHDESDPASSNAPWKIYNIGNDRSVDISLVVELLEAELGETAIKELAPMQPGDVAETRADIGDLVRDVGFRPSTSLVEGIKSLVAWYRSYYGWRAAGAVALPDGKAE
jgi:UDP-glucuronate 4-epimerase